MKGGNVPLPPPQKKKKSRKNVTVMCLWLKFAFVPIPDEFVDFISVLVLQC